MCVVDIDVGELTDQLGIVAAEVDDSIILGATLQLARVFFRVIGHQDSLSTAHHLPADLETLLIQAMLQGGQTLFFQRFRGFIFQVGRRRTRSWAVDEGERKVETHVFDQLHGLLEIFFGLAGEADDEVRADADARYGGSQFAQLGFVFEGGVIALHRRQDPVGTRLHRQVQVFDQFGHFGVGQDQTVGKFQRVRGGVANTVDAIDCRDHSDQLGQIGHAPVMRRAAIAVDVLPQKRHFAHAVFGQVHDFGDNTVERTTDFFAPGVGHHAEGAVFAATFHH